MSALGSGHGVQTTKAGLSSTFAPKPTGTPDGTKFYKDDGTWAVPAGGGGGLTVADLASVFFRPCPVGQYIPPLAFSPANQGMNLANSTANSALYIRTCRVVAVGAYSYDRVAFGQAIAATDSGSEWAVALYTTDGAFVKELGTVSATGATGEKAITISESLAAGVHVLALRWRTSTTAGTNPQVYGFTGQVGEVEHWNVAEAMTGYVYLHQVASSLDAWPSTLPRNGGAVSPGTAAPRISLRRSA